MLGAGIIKSAGYEDDSESKADYTSSEAEHETDEETPPKAKTITCEPE